MAALSGVSDDIPDDGLDAEWDDFQRLLTQYKHRHRLTQSPILDLEWEPKARAQATFYPCPPPTEDDEKEIDAISLVGL